MKKVCINCNNKNQDLFIVGKSKRIHGVSYVVCKVCGNVMFKIEGRDNLLQTPEEDTILTRMMMADAAISCGLPSNIVAINEEELINKFNEFINSLENKKEDPCEDCDCEGEDCYECECINDEENEDDELIDAINQTINEIKETLITKYNDQQQYDKINSIFDKKPIVFGPNTSPTITPFTFSKEQQSICYMAITIDGQVIVKHVNDRKDFLKFLNENKIEVKEIYKCKKEIVNREFKYI